MMTRTSSRNIGKLFSRESWVYAIVLCPHVIINQHVHFSRPDNVKIYMVQFVVVQGDQQHIADQFSGVKINVDCCWAIIIALLN